MVSWFKKKSPQSFQPVILITGCASGIGWALSELLEKQTEYRVVVTARSKSLAKLREKFKESDRFWIRPLDVTVEAERAALIAEIQSKWSGVNILINNAGISYRAVVEHMTEQDEFRQLATNYLGPVELIRLVVPGMRALGRGKIINISSVSGMLAMPTMASYSASKYALEGLSEALWYEMRPFGINVCLIQPGFIRSSSFQNVYHTKSSDPAVCVNTIYSDFYSNMTPFIERLMGQSRATPDKIAQKILRVIRTGNPPLWIPVTADALVFYYLRRWLPRRFLLPFLFAALPGARHWGESHTNRRLTP